MGDINSKGPLAIILKCNAILVGISVERILFDIECWKELKQKLISFYLSYFIKTASGEFAKQQSV